MVLIVFKKWCCGGRCKFRTCDPCSV